MILRYEKGLQVISRSCQAVDRSAKLVDRVPKEHELGQLQTLGKSVINLSTLQYITLYQGSS